MMRNKRLFSYLTVLFVLLAGGTALAGEQGAEADVTHKMMMLVMQLGAVLFAARLGGALLEKMKMPAVLGELTAGIVIGPYALGIVPLPGLPCGLFPLGEHFPVSTEIYGICCIASIILLFMAGIETDLRLFLRYSLAGSLVGVGGVLFSFVLGDLTAVFLSSMLFDTPQGFLSPPCLFLGIMSTATSVGITARILAERRKLDSPEGVTILAGAVIDDVLGIIMLAIGLGMIKASRDSGQIDWAHIGMIAFKAVGIWLSATLLGILVSYRLGSVLKRFGNRSAIAIMALGMAFLLAALFEEVGLAMIIGAYVMGLSLSRTDVANVIREKLEPIYDFLVPVFFTVMGMLVDVRLLMSGPVLIFGAVYTVIAVIAKLVGCGLPTLLCGFNMRGACRVGIGMMPRGEVALIIAGIGLSAGILSPQVFGVGVMMTLITTILAPLFLVRVFSDPAPGVVRSAKQGHETRQVVYEFPSEDTIEFIVSKLIKIFESDGFFVHALSHEENIYQLRKDEMIITFSHRGNEIVFDCLGQHVGFVGAAMLEVIADFEASLRELRRPVDARAIARRLQETEVEKDSHVINIASNIVREACISGLTGKTKADVIDELLTALSRAGAVRDVDIARKAVFEREAKLSTGMQYGIAMPHGRTDTVARLTCAVGLHREGVDFESLDGEPSRIIVLILAPASSPAPHLHFISNVSRMLNADGREALLACRTGEDMYAVLSGKELRSRPVVEQDAEIVGKADAGRFTLERFLRRDCLKVNMIADSKREAVRELVEKVQICGKIRDVNAVCDAVGEREERMPTGMAHGIAVPHARTEAVNEFTCAVGISRKGIDFGAADGQPCRIIVLALSPVEGVAPQMQFMAAIARCLDSKTIEQALECSTEDELYDLLTKASGS